MAKTASPVPRSLQILPQVHLFQNHTPVLPSHFHFPGRPGTLRLSQMSASLTLYTHPGPCQTSLVQREWGQLEHLLPALTHRGGLDGTVCPAVPRSDPYYGKHLSLLRFCVCPSLLQLGNPEGGVPTKALRRRQRTTYSSASRSPATPQSRACPKVCTVRQRRRLLHEWSSPRLNPTDWPTSSEAPYHILHVLERIVSPVLQRLCTLRLLELLLALCLLHLFLLSEVALRAGKAQEKQRT